MRLLNELNQFKSNHALVFSLGMGKRFFHEKCSELQKDGMREKNKMNESYIALLKDIDKSLKEEGSPDSIISECKKSIQRIDNFMDVYNSVLIENNSGTLLQKKNELGKRIEDAERQKQKKQLENGIHIAIEQNDYKWVMSRLKIYEERFGPDEIMKKESARHHVRYLEKITEDWDTLKEEVREYSHQYPKEGEYEALWVSAQLCFADGAYQKLRAIFKDSYLNPEEKRRELGGITDFSLCSEEQQDYLKYFRNAILQWCDNATEKNRLNVEYIAERCPYKLSKCKVFRIKDPTISIDLGKSFYEELKGSFNCDPIVDAKLNTTSLSYLLLYEWRAPVNEQDFSRKGAYSREMYLVVDRSEFCVTISDHDGMGKADPVSISCSVNESDILLGYCMASKNGVVVKISFSCY